MMENSIHDTDVIQETNALPETQASVVEEAQSSPAIVPPVQQENQEMRFKTLRQLKEKAERERDEALRLLQEKQALKAAPSLSEPDFSLGNDDIAEGKHLKALQSKIEKLESKLSEYHQSSSTMTAEARLKATYPDIEKVVSKENMEVLAVQYPELFATLQSNNDFYSKGAAAYTMLKRLNIHVDDTPSEEKVLAYKNNTKPRPTASISPQQGDSPLSHANAFASGLTEDLKSQLYKEMIAAMRNH